MSDFNAMDGVAMVFVCVIAFTAFILAVAALLMPIWVWSIKDRVAKIEKYVASWDTELRTTRITLEKQVKLQRQLLRSYGHEPEA